MRRRDRSVRRKVSVLTDARPSFVSLVQHGANMTPFKFVKADDDRRNRSRDHKGKYTNPPGGSKSGLTQTQHVKPQPSIADIGETEEQQKGATSMGKKKTAKNTLPAEPDVHQIRFAHTAFETEEDVAAWLDQRGYEDYKITDGKDAFIVKGYAKDKFEGELSEVKLHGDDVVATVGMLKADKLKAKKDEEEDEEAGPEDDEEDEDEGDEEELSKADDEDDADDDEDDDEEDEDEEVKKTAEPRVRERAKKNIGNDESCNTKGKKGKKKPEHAMKAAKSKEGTGEEPRFFDDVLEDREAEEKAWKETEKFWRMTNALSSSLASIYANSKNKQKDIKATCNQFINAVAELVADISDDDAETVKKSAHQLIKKAAASSQKPAPTNNDDEEGDEAVKKEEVEAIVKAAVEAAVKPLTDEITSLKATNEKLTKDFAGAQETIKKSDERLQAVEGIANVRKSEDPEGGEDEEGEEEGTKTRKSSKKTVLEDDEPLANVLGMQFRKRASATGYRR